MDFLATDSVPFLSSLLSISSAFIKEMADSPFSSGEVVHLSLSRLGVLGMILYHLYCLGMLTRLICTAITLNSGGRWLPNYLHYDLLMGLLRRVNFIDGYLALVSWPSLVLAIVLDYTVRFSRQTVSYHLAHDLIVSNRADFWLLNPHLLNNGLASLFHSLLGRGSKITNSTKILFSCPKLLYFPHLSHSVRLKAVALSLLFDIVISSFSLIFSLLGVICVLYYYLLITLRWAYPRWESSLLLVESTAIMYMIWRSTQIAFFLIHSIYLVLFVHVAQQRELNRLLNASVERMKKGGRKSSRVISSSSSSVSSSSASSSSSSPPSSSSSNSPKRRPSKIQNQNNLEAYLLLPYYLRSHLRFIKDLLTTNRELFSPILLLTMLTMFATNVYSVSMTILSKKVTFMENSLLMLISVLSSFFLLISVRPAVVAATEVADASKHLYRAQSYLLSGNSFLAGSRNRNGEANLRLKLKVATYFEVLNNSEERFAYTVGPVGKVTNESIFQVNDILMG